MGPNQTSVEHCNTESIVGLLASSREATNLIRPVSESHKGGKGHKQEMTFYLPRKGVYMYSRAMDL